MNNNISIFVSEMNLGQVKRIGLLSQELQCILVSDPKDFPSMHVHQLVLKFYHN